MAAGFADENRVTGLQLGKHSRAAREFREVAFAPRHEDRERRERNLRRHLGRHPLHCLGVRDHDRGRHFEFGYGIRHLGLQNDKAAGFLIEKLPDRLDLRRNETPFRRTEVNRHHKNCRASFGDQPGNERLIRFPARFDRFHDRRADCLNSGSELRRTGNRRDLFRGREV